MGWWDKINPFAPTAVIKKALLDSTKKKSSAKTNNDSGETLPSSVPLPGLAGEGQNIYEQLVRFGPQLAQQEYEAQAKYGPLLAQLGLNIQKDILPQQYGLDLSLAQEYQPQFQTLQQQLRSADIEAQLGDVARLAPQLQDIRQQAETPEVTAIRQTLQQQILENLSKGEKLTEEQLREVQQGVRSGQMARGLGMGQGSANREAVARSLEGRKLAQQRRGEASQLLAQESKQQFDPFLSIAGRPATAQAAAMPFITNPGTQVAQAGQVASPTGLGSNLLGMATQQQQAQLQNQQYNLQLQLARANANRLGVNI